MTPFILLYALVGTAVAASTRTVKDNSPGTSFADTSLLADTSTGAMKTNYPFYHTGRELQSEIKELASNCSSAALSFRSIHQGNVSIDVVDVSREGVEAPNRVFFLFGEHSRELISPESGLKMLKVLCGQGNEESQKLADTVLKQSRFQVVLNGNPRSRSKVELGEYCLREDPEGVDLNRNWDEDWHGGESTGGMADTNPGPAAFSEKETQIFKDLVSAFKPTTFFTIHSGTYGMYMPWAYDTEHLASRNQPAMMEILRTVDAEHCQCPFGAAGREVGYACPGTSLDWVYDKLETPYAFAFEIYTRESTAASLKKRWQEKASEVPVLLQASTHLAHEHYHSVFQGQHSDFVQKRQTRTRSERAAAACFAQFNPPTQAAYDTTVENWAKAYLETSRLVAADLEKKKQAQSNMIMLEVPAGKPSFLQPRVPAARLT